VDEWDLYGGEEVQASLSIITGENAKYETISRPANNCMHDPNHYLTQAQILTVRDIAEDLSRELQFFEHRIGAIASEVPQCRQVSSPFKKAVMKGRDREEQ
jgi:hypothetical protein